MSSKERPIPALRDCERIRKLAIVNANRKSRAGLRPSLAVPEAVHRGGIAYPGAPGRRSHYAARLPADSKIGNRKS